MDSVIIKVVSKMAYPCSVVSVQNIMVSVNKLSTFHYGALCCPRINKREGGGHVYVSRTKLLSYKNSILGSQCLETFVWGDSE